MRRAAKKDANQRTIERHLSQRGIYYKDVSSLSGGGCDLLVWFGGRPWIVEVKNPEDYPKYFFTSDSATREAYLITKLTTSEEDLRQTTIAAGDTYVITYSTDDLLRKIGAIKKPFSK